MEATDRENTRSYELQNINQALDLIDILIAAREGLTLSRLSRISGLSKNKIFRILSTLEQRGMVEKDLYCNYRLGISAFGTAHRILSSTSMLDQARPIMAGLAARLNEAIYLVTMVGGEAMFQEMIDCQQAIRTESFVGSRFPLPDLTNAGCAAEQSGAEAGRVQVAALNEEVTAVSAVLIDVSGNIAGALVALAPTFRMSAERIISEITPSLASAAQQLSGMLGADMVRTVQAHAQQQALELSGKQPVIIAARAAHYPEECHAVSLLVG